MHHSKERYLELLDSFDGVTETYHLTSLTVRLALLNRITRRYWTVSPGVTGPYHLMILDCFACHYWTYWTVPLCITETYHPMLPVLQDSNRAVQYSLICDWLQSTWHISQWHRQISWSIFSKYLTIKRALPARQTIASQVTSFTIHNIPEFSRKLTYFLRSFLNIGFCSKRRWRFFLSVLLNLLTANQKTYSILVY